MRGGRRSSRAFIVSPVVSRWDIASPRPSPPGGDQLAAHLEQRVDVVQLPLRHCPDSSPRTMDPPSMESANGVKICRTGRLVCRCRRRRCSHSFCWSLPPLVPGCSSSLSIVPWPPASTGGKSSPDVDQDV